MAGLLDQHQMGGQGEALKMVELMAAYFCGRCASGWCVASKR